MNICRVCSKILSSNVFRRKICLYVLCSGNWKRAQITAHFWYLHVLFSIGQVGVENTFWNFCHALSRPKFGTHMVEYFTNSTCSTCRIFCWMIFVEAGKKVAWQLLELVPWATVTVACTYVSVSGSAHVGACTNFARLLWCGLCHILLQFRKTFAKPRMANIWRTVSLRWHGPSHVRSSKHTHTQCSHQG